MAFHPNGGYRIVKLRDEAVVEIEAKEHSEPIVERLSTPSEANWRQFWDEIDRLRLWDWRKEYVTPHILDGTDWSLLIRHERQIRISGCNGFPLRDSKIRHFDGSDLEKFENSLNRLLGATSPAD